MLNVGVMKLARLINQNKTAVVVGGDDVRIHPELIPDIDYGIGCSVLKGCIKRFFEQPGVREDYERWKREVYDVEEQERELIGSKKCG